jgi:WD40 repeat protein
MCVISPCSRFVPNSPCQAIQPSPTLTLVNDCLRFAVVFFEAIHASVSHIYHSALPLSPRTSMVRDLYQRYICPLARVIHGLPDSWAQIPTIMSDNRESIATAAWSPCGKFIAVARRAQLCSEIMKTEVIDGMTLTRVHDFETPQNSNQWLSFSPDSSLLIRFNEKSELTVWDLQTGGPVGTISSEQEVSALSSTSSIAHSKDGKVVAVAHRGFFNTESAISTFDLLSRTDECSYRAPEGRIVLSLWTHYERLRLAISEPGSITVWETGFASMNTLTEVESFPTPDNFDFSPDTLFLPSRSRLAFTREGTVLVWDARNSKFLLDVTRLNLPFGTSFSSDGGVFACGTTSHKVDIWRETRTGYGRRRRIICTAHAITTPLLSPDGESIATLSGSTIQLWRTKDPIPSRTAVPSQSRDDTQFLLEFSQDKTLVAVARLWDKKITVLDSKSGAPRLIVDTGMNILGLGITETTVLAVGGGKIVTWNLPATDRPTVAEVVINDRVRTTTFEYSAPGVTPSGPCTSISPDSNRMAIAWRPLAGSNYLNIYDLTTGECLTGIATGGIGPWLAPDGCEVWCTVNDSPAGWSISRDEDSNLTELEPLGVTTRPPAGFPWRSSGGYAITDDWWILSPSGRRLLLLPKFWRLPPEQLSRKWVGRFLGLLHRELPEAVILELDE